MEPVDLEAILPEGEQPEPAPPVRRRRRWPWLALLGSALIGSATYALVARAAVRDLEQHWLAACDAAVRAQSAGTSRYAPGSPRLLPEEVQALQQRAEDVEAHALAAIRQSVRRVRAVDPGVRRLREAVYEAAQPLNVNSCVPPRSEPPRRIDAILRAELKRWHLKPATAVATPVPLPPITVTTLPIATERTDSTIVVGTGSSAYVVDIDAGTTREIAGVPGGYVGGPGWLVRRRGTEAFLDRTGEEPFPLGTASYLAPGAGDDSVWLVDATTELAQAREVDTRSGAFRGPAVTLPQFATLIGATTSGLVLDHEPSGIVEVWDPIAARTRLVVGTTHGWPIARGDLVVRTTCGVVSCDLHVTEASTGRERTVPVEGQIHAQAISPDGQTVAVAVRSEYRNVGDLQLVDVVTGRVRWLRTSWFSPPAIAWGRASDRIFLVSGLAAREVWMYETADNGAFEQLRLRVDSTAPFDAIAVM
jgi:hypothetical protein